MPPSRAIGPSRLVSLIFAVISFGAWILYVTGWGIFHQIITRSNSSVEIYFIPLWCFVASGPLVLVTSLFRDLVTLSSNEAFKNLGWIFAALYIILLIIYLISGAVLIIGIGIIAFLGIKILILLVAFSPVIIVLLVLICCGAISAITCQCVSCVAAIVSWASSTDNQNNNRIVVVHPMQPTTMIGTSPQLIPMYPMQYMQPMNHGQQPMHWGQQPMHWGQQPMHWGQQPMHWGQQPKQFNPSGQPMQLNIESGQPPPYGEVIKSGLPMQMSPSGQAIDGIPAVGASNEHNTDVNEEVPIRIPN